MSSRVPFASLGVHDLEVLELMAAVVVPVTRSAVVDWLKSTGRRLSPQRAYSSREVREVVARLLQLKLLGSLEHMHAFDLPSVVRHEVLARAHRERRLQPLVNSIRRIEPLRPHTWSFSEAAAIREFAWSVHLGLSDEMRKEYDTVERVLHTPRKVLVALGIGPEPPVAGLQQLPGELVAEYLDAISRVCLRDLQPMSRGLLDWVLEQPIRVAAGPRCQLALILALQAEPARAQAMLAGLDDATSESVRAFIALTCDQPAEARSLARKAVERSRTKSTKRLKGVSSPVGAWLVTLLLTDSDLTSQSYARAQLEYELKLKDIRSWLQTTLRQLDTLVNQTGDLQDVRGTFSDVGAWHELMLHCLVARYSGQRLSRELHGQLVARSKDAAGAGFNWLRDALAALASSSAAHTLLKLYAIEAPWERTLRALEVAVAADEAVTDTASERLTWTLALGQGGRFELTARLQSRTASGWTSGRVISWKRLAEVGHGASFTTDRDRRMLQHIYVERDPGYWGGGPSTRINPAGIIDLVGHPLVFADGNMSAPVEVVAGTSRVEVREESGSLKLTLAPEALLRDTVVCEREGKSRLVVYLLNEAQRRVARVFGGAAIHLPSEAAPAAQDTLAKLAQRFTVSGEHSLAAGQIEEVAADGRLRVRLRRRSQGVAVRVCVVPLEDARALVPGRGDARLILHVSAGQSVKPVCALRDLKDERRALEALYAACPILGDAVGAEHEGALDDLESCLELLCQLRAADALVEWPEGTTISLIAERDVRDVRLSLASAADWLAADGDIEIDGTTRLALHELLARAAAARGRFIALDDGRFVALTDRLKKRLDNMAALAVVEDASVALHPMWLSIAGRPEDYGELRCDEPVTNLLVRVREARELTPALPRDFGAELRAYQREGYEWLCRLAHIRAGACLADDMGLGKTLQALALLLNEASHGPSLVVAPTSVCPNWFDEARRFAPRLRLHDLAGAEREALIEGIGPFDVLVSSYGLVQQELEALSGKHFRVVILDEAQAIKNVTTQRARAVQKLRADIRVALTGTPVENHLGELWGVMHFLNPGLLGSAKAFEERFARPITRDADPQASHTLKRLIRPFVLRRRKSEVLDDLPPKTVITLRIQPSDAERALFSTLRERALARLHDPNQSAGEGRIQILAELMRLRRAACHPQLVVPEAEIASSKLEAFEALLHELREGGHRVLVFSQFIDYLALVRARLDALGIGYQYLDGSSSTAARKRAIGAFQAGDGEVFLISLKAGGFGLNLTAADYVIHLDPWWNPAVEEQASDRAHRIGQTRPVTIYRLVMSQSIEEKILALHDHKRDLADRLLEGTSGAGILSLDELMALIRPESEPPRRVRAPGAHATSH